MAAALPRLAKEERDLAVRRVFQALRIEVNDEFSALETLLRLLRPASTQVAGRPSFPFIPARTAVSRSPLKPPCATASMPVYSTEVLSAWSGGATRQPPFHPSETALGLQGPMTTRGHSCAMAPEGTHWRRASPLT